MAYRIYNQNAPRIRGVLFDMDGLVLDTEKLYTRFWMEACAHFGYPMSWEQALGMRSLSSTAGQAQLEQYFGKGIELPAIRAERIARMEAFIDQNGVEPKPGIYELLDYLQTRGIATAITSSSPIERIRKHLGSLGLLERFDRLCSGHDVPRGKPEPDIYLYGAAALGLRPEECLALEDSPTGVLSAYRARCHTVMIPDQDQPTAETEKLLFAIADSLRDVVDLLERI